MASNLVKLTIEHVKDFNADDIFDCGQCFRWNREDDGSYSGIVGGAFANVAFYPYDPGLAENSGDAGEGTTRHLNEIEGRIVIWSNLLEDTPTVREKFWRNYLDLDRDYSAIKRLLTTEDTVMARAVRMGAGIRVLNQNKWETLISFIISQNNNIPRIKGCIERLCAEYGKKIGMRHGEAVYAFPSVDRLSVLRESDLDVCRMGYRARYIAETARQVAFDGGAILDAGERMETKKIEEYLHSLSGVGPKVAACILLFSMKKAEVFPIDIWVRRVMNRLYGMGEENISAMKDYAARNFGAYGGIAQQYLFNYIRKLAKNDPAAYERLRLEEAPKSPLEGDGGDSKSESSRLPAVSAESPEILAKDAGFEPSESGSSTESADGESSADLVDADRPSSGVLATEPVQVSISIPPWSTKPPIASVPSKNQDT